MSSQTETNAVIRPPCQLYLISPLDVGGDFPARLERALEAGPVAGLRAFLALWRKIVVDSDFRAGCPVLAVSIEEPPTDETPPPW